MHHRRVHAALFLIVAATVGAALANGCSATTPQSTFSSSTAATGGGGVSGTGGHGGTTTSTVTGSGGGIITIPTNTGGGDAGQDVYVDPCKNQCGPVELCDDEHLGLDDNCDGKVDEGCPCQAGQAHFCFKGNPAERGQPGCYDGTEICNELGQFGPCVGGVHAWPPDNCFQNDTSACHAIQTPPYTDVHLKKGTGNFSANAVPGTESYAVQCPSGVSQCPAVSPPDTYKPLQSGEYMVTYSKMVQGDPNPKTCTFSLFVGAPGLRVELSWEHSMADQGVDLDLHLHEPNDTHPWGTLDGVPQDCAWNNCVVDDFMPPQDPSSPNWFADPPALPPTPVDWYEDTSNPENNTCYYDPRGVGAEWASLGKGCHNPRLDVDNIDCDYSVTDPNDEYFCTPENINIDYPPVGQWIRVAVHYYSNHDLNYDVHPEVKIFCDGWLAADLGPSGYYVNDGGSSKITFEPVDGADVGENRFWMVADVAFTADICGKTLCTVQPIFSDPALKTPLFTTDTVADAKFGPPYPPPP